MSDDVRGLPVDRRDVRLSQWLVGRPLQDVVYLRYLNSVQLTSHNSSNAFVLIYLFLFIYLLLILLYLFIIANYFVLV